MSNLRQMREGMEQQRRALDVAAAAMRDAAVWEIVQTMRDFDLKISDIVLALNKPAPPARPPK